MLSIFINLYFNSLKNFKLSVERLLEIFFQKKEKGSIKLPAKEFPLIYILIKRFPKIFIEVSVLD